MRCINTFFISLLLLSSLAFTAQSAPRVPHSIGQNGLIYCTHSTGFSFNPQTVDVGTSMNVVAEQIYNKLFEIKNNQRKDVIGALAQHYRLSGDRKTLLIELRKGVKFHQTPWFTPTRELNADDVVFSLNRVLGRLQGFPNIAKTAHETSDNPQYRIYYDYAKENRYPYFDSIDFDKKIKSVTAVNPYLVKIELFAPDGSILEHLASQYAVILSQEYAQQLSTDDNIVQLDTLPVGTGAYQVEAYFRNQYVRLKRNDNFWGARAKIDNIVIDLSTSHSGRLEKMLNNECDIMAYPEPSQINNLLRSRRFNAARIDGMNLAFLAFNLKQSAVKNITTRRAIAQAINRKRIVERIFFNNAQVANTLIPQSSWAAQFGLSQFADDYNPKAAKTALSDKALHLNFWVLTDNRVYNPSPIKMAEIIRHDLQQAGVNVVMRYIQHSEFEHLSERGEANYDIILGGWLTGSLDPNGFMKPILGCDNTSHSNNLSHYCNRTFDTLLSDALKSPALESRARNYELAQRLAMHELPLIPIANAERIMIYNKRLDGMRMQPLGSIQFSELSITEKGK
ncbi:ABC transporter substrate-binding protein [Pasteurellaceae bacterium HPA106]|uniref:ABC transporter substrate-binding protein n=1 Tax=Spirabiliibacterium pneumoniae TaxID=221400 RepID=UPI001AAD5AFB|nr:ABC transporter substrate-binding protein [Spirabiliibacterium pneumoniae]MBE2896792.1 ABC transporter substrate-binding protein [Spirabiliibacterium pneumoniae]